MLRLFLLISFIGCFGQSAAAAELQIFPLRLVLAPTTPISAFRVTNTGQQTVRLQLKISQWDQNDDGDDFQPTSDIIGNPPLFAIDGKATQTARIGIAKNQDQDNEKTYRAFFQEIPAASRKNTAVQTLLQISVPIFIPPTHPLPPKLSFTPVRKGEERLIEIRNDSNQHIQLLKLTVTGSDGKAIVKAPMSLYILAGRRQIWKTQSRGAWPEILHIDAETDQGPLTADISGRNVVTTATP